MPRHFESRQVAAFESKRYTDVVGAQFVGGRDQRLEQFREIDIAGFLTLQFGVEPAGVGNIRNQPIKFA